MTSEREDIDERLKGLYEHWDSIREETIDKLGLERALCIIDFHANNWIDITQWLNTEYRQEELMNIMVFQHSRLFKESYWLQFIFLRGNYPMMYRNLRYILELMTQAYYVQQHGSQLTLDEQVARTAEIEEERYGWRKLVRPVLAEVLDSEEDEVDDRLGQFWSVLNKNVHPSAMEMDVIADEDFGALIRDSFNERLAEDVLDATGIVFDLSNAIMFAEFSRIVEPAQQSKYFLKNPSSQPYTARVIGRV